jgi:RimJ/RimL family protein N-acetyltransferase
LRPVDAEADLERCFQWFNDPEVTRYLCSVGPPITREQEREILSRPRDPAHEVLFAIDAEDGTHIGNCALHRICRLSRSAILGIALGDKSRWSQGYGTDAVRTLCAFAFVELNLQRIGLTLHARNDRARRCYEKCGFQVEGRLRRAVYSRGAYDDELVMGVLREEFQAKHPERWPSEE